MALIDVETVNAVLALLEALMHEYDSKGQKREAAAIYEAMERIRALG
jgi:hypothetical protein